MLVTCADTISRTYVPSTIRLIYFPMLYIFVRCNVLDLHTVGSFLSVSSPRFKQISDANRILYPHMIDVSDGNRLHRSHTSSVVYHMYHVDL